MVASCVLLPVMAHGPRVEQSSHDLFGKAIQIPPLSFHNGSYFPLVVERPAE